MPFIGNQPALSYTSFAKQDFTVTATTSYSLDHPVANANEIALFINFVRQEPTTAYSASGTTLTLTSATSSSDDMYCVYLGKAVQTVNPPNASVGASQIVDGSVTTAKILDANITSAKLASGVLPTNTPSFFVRNTNNQSASDNTFAKIQYNDVILDTDNGFDNTTNYRYQIPTGKGGKYLFFYNMLVGSTSASQGRVLSVFIYKNGSSTIFATEDKPYINDATKITSSAQIIHDCSAGDFFEVYAALDTGSGGVSIEAQTGANSFGGYKIIGA